ncbi:unnamed protein product [Paramecium octaurelia]|uniref:OTU domain-containing protein n=1 Tax=Paramecium octaurelia TaxID=43137 RepID=A0A8S1W746_PAROT|nr:unnamed protein product [Paramecium octaurelia]
MYSYQIGQPSVNQNTTSQNQIQQYQQRLQNQGQQNYQYYDEQYEQNYQKQCKPQNNEKNVLYNEQQQSYELQVSPTQQKYSQPQQPEQQQQQQQEQQPKLQQVKGSGVGNEKLGHQNKKKPQQQQQQQQQGQQFKLYQVKGSGIGNGKLEHQNNQKQQQPQQQQQQQEQQPKLQQVKENENEKVEFQNNEKHQQPQQQQQQQQGQYSKFYQVKGSGVGNGKLEHQNNQKQQQPQQQQQQQEQQEQEQEQEPKLQQVKENENGKAEFQNNQNHQQPQQQQKQQQQQEQQPKVQQVKENENGKVEFQNNQNHQQPQQQYQQQNYYKGSKIQEQQGQSTQQQQQKEQQQQKQQTEQQLNEEEKGKIEQQQEKQQEQKDQSTQQQQQQKQNSESNEQDQKGKIQLNKSQEDFQKQNTISDLLERNENRQQLIYLILQKINKNSSDSRAVSEQYKRYIQDQHDKNDLSKEYNIKRLATKQQLYQICQGYIQVRGDGNCFYTAFGYQFLKHLLITYQDDQFNQFIYNIKNINLRCRIQIKDFKIDNLELEKQILDEFIYQIQQLRIIEDIEERKQELLNQFSQYELEQDGTAFLYALSTIFFRNLSYYLVEQDAEAKTLIGDQQNNLLIWETECNSNEIVIMLLAKYLKLNITLIFFENEEFIVNQYEEKNENKIILLIRPGHYNIGTIHDA